jgi:chromosome segregation ATPase
MPPERLPDNRALTTVAADTMTQQIEKLLGADAPTLARLEETLTEGYAQALALEAERWRLERRLGEMAREGGDVGEELQSLGKRLTSADSELAELRMLLGSLQARTRSARAAAS